MTGPIQITSAALAIQRFRQLNRAGTVPMGDPGQRHHENQYNREWDYGGAQNAPQPALTIRRLGNTREAGGKRRLPRRFGQDVRGGIDQVTAGAGNRQNQGGHQENDAEVVAQVEVESGASAAAA